MEHSSNFLVNRGRTYIQYLNRTNVDKLRQFSATLLSFLKGFKLQFSAVVLKTFILCCLLGSSTYLQAGFIGDGFTIDNLIRDLVWNQEKGRIEFKVMVHDNYGTKNNQYFGGHNDGYGKPGNGAYLYINDNLAGRITEGCRQGTNTDNYANFCFYSKTPNIYVLARGETSECTYITNTTLYSIFPTTAESYKYYTIAPNRVTSDPIKANHMYAEFYWYPDIPISATKVISVQLKTIQIQEDNTWEANYIPDVSKTVTMTVPADNNHSISGGLIGQDGLTTISCRADEGDGISLMSNDGLSPVISETKMGQNLTFTGNYFGNEQAYLNGRKFVFDVIKKGDTGLIWFKKRSSSTLNAQTTGVFAGTATTTVGTCGELNLSWQIKNPTNTDNVNTQGFNLQVKKGTGEWTTITNAPEYEDGKQNYNFKYQISNNDLNKGVVNYQFRIKREFASWSSTSLDTTFFIKKWQSLINTDFKEIANPTLEVGKDNYPLLKWVFSSSGIECNNNIKLKLIIGNTETEIPRDSILKGSYQTKSTEGMIECTPQRYQLILQYGTLESKTYTVNPNYVFQPSGKRKFERIDASKGYFSNQVLLKWYIVPNYDEFTKFRLVRKPLDAPESEYETLTELTHTRGKLYYSFSDPNINAGIYYNYRVIGIYQCNDSVGNLLSDSEIGFSQPYGSVSGRITYLGNTAVKDVRVNINTSDALRCNREIEFSGSGQNKFVEIPANSKMLNPAGFSFQTWIKMLQPDNGYIFNNNNVGLFVQGGGDFVQVNMNGSPDWLRSSSNRLQVGEYHHLSFTVRPLSTDNKTFERGIYIDGKLDVKDTTTLSIPMSINTKSIILGNESSTTTVFGRILTGRMDDVRFWNKALNTEEIAINYDRVLSGKESGLVAYYRCDETDAINGYIFDSSADGSNFNGNHARKGSGVTRHDVAVNASHLAIKGVADKDGIYQITNVVPFTNEGTTYIVQPEFGIHEFDPSKRPLFFSPDSKVFNNVDFTDISSFEVSGTITYKNSNYPVDSVAILVDGNNAVIDGKMVMTNSDGYFKVNVPIGSHFLSVAKSGHQFANGGRFPANKLEKFNFQNNINNINFTDLTTIRLVGRVVGGESEADKLVGFGLSKANIGKATVTLKAVNDKYKLNIGENDSIVTDNVIGGKLSKTTFKHVTNGSEIKIEANAETGEFLAVLPPVPYAVSGVKTLDFEDTFTGSDYKFNYNATQFNMNPSNLTTLKYVDKLGSYTNTCHDSLVVTRFNDPNISVRDLGAAEGAFGDSIYKYVDNVIKENSTNIPLYKVNADKSISYTLGHPVFNQATKTYVWEISAFEKYINRDDGNDIIVDNVPLTGKEISIDNGLSSMTVEINTTNNTETLTASAATIMLDSVGKAKYRFRTGFPKLSGEDYLLSASMNLVQNGKTYAWKNPLSNVEAFKGFMIGMVPIDGNNFVTQGPDNVDVVLNDPPGSNSFAWIEKESSIIKEETNTFQFDTNEAMNATIHLGPDFVSNAGLGFSIEFEIDVTADITGGMQWAQSNMSGNSSVTTTTFNQQISTSSDPAYVGAMADVYIGKSTNRVFSKQRNLALYPQADAPLNSTVGTGSFKLYPKEVTAVGQKFSTAFTYTQDYIVNTLIPNIKNLRNDKITAVTTIPNAASLNFDNKKNPLYFTTKNRNEDIDFGEDRTYYVFFAPDAPADKKIDEIADYNSWIANWEQTIANNEKHKLDLFSTRATAESKNVMNNRSFDSGVTVTESNTASFEETKLSSSMHSFGGFNENSYGVTINGVGFEGTVAFSRDNIWNKEVNNSTANELTFGFELSEGANNDISTTSSDAISLDIYNPLSTDLANLIFDNKKVNNLHGYVFKRRAGQTSCPYEGEERTLYYEKGQHVINEATFKVENPDLYIGSGAKTATVSNVPSGRETSFNLELQNQSEVNLPITYQLKIDDDTNPNGLILSIDGTPLTDPRNYIIQYGTPLFKSLKVRQSSTDILDYTGIKLLLASGCDDNIYSEVIFDVHFTPSSSPVTLKANQTLANRAKLNEGAKIKFSISEYDRSYRNFGCIRLQYRKKTDDTWINLKEFVNDAALYPLTGDRVLITEDALEYDYSFTETTPSDGEYIFRALTVSKIGSNEVTSSSQEINIVKDVTLPKILGNASPVNGILNAGDEISITFNEDIQPDMVTADKFSIKGILNADNRTEPTVGLAFDGSGKAFTEQAISTNGSFSIEGWIKLPTLAAGTLFSFGEGNTYFSLGFDASGHAVVTIGSEVKTSTNAVEASEVWKYLSVSFERTNNEVSVNVFEGANLLKLFRNMTFSQTPATQGRLYVGNTGNGNAGFKGAIGLVHFYNVARSSEEISSTKSINKSGNEPNLIGLWELDEGEGSMAADKARSRNLTLNTSWYIYPTGKALTFNGSNEYAKLPSSTFPMGVNDDFSLEFWFKGATQEASTLLSAGTNVHIGFNATKELTLTVDNTTQLLTKTNLLNDQWHHFALSVKRSAMATALIDGIVTATFNSSIFNANVGGSYYNIAAKHVLEGEPAIDIYSEHFNGNIDEVRVWKSYLTSKDILLSKNNKLRGSEAGLVAYYPFESYQKTDQLITVLPSLKDMVTSESTAYGTTIFSDFGAAMKDFRPVKNVAFNYTASNRKIVLDITDEDYKIEGVTLQVSAKDILDTHNNPSNAYRWTAFVNRNPLKWNTDDVNIVMAQGETKSFTASIVNKGSESIDYVIDNIPYWLSASQTQGTLKPLATKDILFNVPTGTNIGSYETAISLTSANNIRELLAVQLKVTGTRPDWGVNPHNYTSSMSLVGQVQIEGAPQEDADDMMAAFMGDVCVGVTKPVYIKSQNTYYVFMDVYGNENQIDQQLKFRFWDASTGRIYPQVISSQNATQMNILFEPEETKYAKILSPIILNALDVIEQQIPIASGWNWISMNVESATNNLLAQFKTQVNTNCLLIKSQNAYLQSEVVNNNVHWFGTPLADLSTKGTYLTNFVNASTLKMEGKPVTVYTTSLTLNSGWSWIGYTPQFITTVSHAFSGINPAEGDQIKSQRGFSVYNVGNGWIGSLNYMEPSKGYMYYWSNAQPTSLVYPSANLSSRSPMFRANHNTQVENHWNTDYHRFANNMTFTTAVLENGNELKSNLIEIGAFVGNDCRGSVVLSFCEGLPYEYLGFLMVYGESGEKFNFKIFDHSSNLEFPANNMGINFRANDKFGTITDPYKISMTTTSNLETSFANISIYPNPVDQLLLIESNSSTFDLLEITDLSGRSIYKQANFNRNSINVSDLNKGMYLLKLVKENQNVILKFTKK